VLAPFVPSDTARGAVAFYPITRSLCEALDSEPGRLQPIGLPDLVSFHAPIRLSNVPTAWFNPLIAGFARDIGHVELTWLRWALAASVPDSFNDFVPYLLYRLNPPDSGTWNPHAHCTREPHNLGE